MLKKFYCYIVLEKSKLNDPSKIYSKLFQLFNGFFKLLSVEEISLFISLSLIFFKFALKLEFLLKAKKNLRSKKKLKK